MMPKNAKIDVMGSQEAIQRFGLVEELARKHYQAKSAKVMKRYGGELFSAIHDDASMRSGKLSPVAALAHNTIARRGRWGDPIETAADIAQAVALKLIEKKHKWPLDLPFKVLLARIVTCTALDTIKKNYRHYRNRKHDGTKPGCLEATDILASAIDHKIIPEHAYDRLLSEIINRINQMSPIEQSVAQKRIMDIETMSGKQFALFHGKSGPWASGQYRGVKKNLELYILAVELGICH